MDAGLFNWIWLAAGVALLASEFVVPTLTALFFGAAALVVAGLRFAGLLESHTASLILWAVASIAAVLLLRRTLQGWVEPEKSRGSISEDARAYGSVVEVVVTVTPDGRDGRVRFDGTSWPAISRRGTLLPGSRARLIHRDNLAWVVEPADVLAADKANPGQGAA